MTDYATEQNLRMAQKMLEQQSEVNRLTADLAAANAALASVSDLLDQARTERDEARANLAEEIAVAIENQDDQGIVEFDLLYQDCARIARQTACQAVTSWTAVEDVLAGREADECTYVCIADVRAAWEGKR